MPKKTLARIEVVAADVRPFTLRVRWAHGEDSVIDVSELIGSFRIFAPLRADPALFAAVRVGEYGTHVAWSEEIDMAATTLWRLAQEQSGATMSADAFRRWREGRNFTQDAAARALGVSRRMLAYWEQGDRPVPRTVALATRGLDLGA
jgi:DNA-binding transcriptional regulator YiaG